MLLPGPEAQQLATYIGWLMHRTPGGLVAGGLFIVPGIIAIMALSYIYAAYGNVGYVAALFFGLKAAVLAIVVEAVVRIGKRALKNRVMIAIAAAAFVAIFFFAVPFPVIIIAAGVIGFIGARRAGRVRGGGHGDGNGPAATSTACSARPCPTTRDPIQAGRYGSSALWLALVARSRRGCRVVARADNVFSQIAIFF